MAWDFTADSDIQREMSKILTDKAELLDGEFTNMYSKIGELGTHWVGSDYDAFQTGCEGYKTALSDLSTSVKMYAAHFEKIATGTDELATALISIVKTMTKRDDVGVLSGSTSDTNTTDDKITTTDDKTTTTDDKTTTTDDKTTTTDDKTTTDDSNSGSMFEDPYKGAEDSDTVNDDSDTGNGGDVKKYDSVTINSGDVVNINGKNLVFYGAYSEPRGTSVNMYADSDGNLFYEDGSPVKITRASGNGSPITIDANKELIGKSVTENSHGSNWPSYWKLLDADGNVLNQNKIASSVMYENGEQAPALIDGVNLGSLIENDMTITKTAELKNSYVNATPGDVINGHSIAVPTSMQGLSASANDGVDIIRIDPEYKVQWDPSSKGGNGFDFDTKNGPVYLIKSADKTSDGETYYNLCDEYGNVINSKQFTISGFNTEYGKWK